MTDVASSKKSKNREIYELWKCVQDIIGEASKWPKIIRRLFWTENLIPFQRCMVAAFAYVNGLNSDIFLHWAEKQHLCKDSSISALQGFVYSFSKEKL